MEDGVPINDVEEKWTEVAPCSSTMTTLITEAQSWVCENEQLPSERAEASPLRGKKGGASFQT